MPAVTDALKTIKLAEEILYSGRAFEKFKQIIKAQKGTLKELIPNIES